MINEQSSSAVYGVFFDVEFREQVLLGLYFLEGEAEAARQAYIDKRVSGLEFPDLLATYARWLQAATMVRRLEIGQAADYNFVA